MFDILIVFTRVPAGKWWRFIFFCFLHRMFNDSINRYHCYGSVELNFKLTLTETNWSNVGLSFVGNPSRRASLFFWKIYSSFRNRLTLEWHVYFVKLANCSFWLERITSCLNKLCVLLQSTVQPGILDSNYLESLSTRFLLKVTLYRYYAEISVFIPFLETWDFQMFVWSKYI